MYAHTHTHTHTQAGTQFHYAVQSYSQYFKTWLCQVSAGKSSRTPASQGLYHTRDQVPGNSIRPQTIKP